MPKVNEIEQLTAGILAVMDNERRKLSAAAQAIQALGQALDPGNNITGVGVASLLNELKEKLAPKPPAPEAPQDKEGKPDITEPQVVSEMIAEQERASG